MEDLEVNRILRIYLGTDTRGGYQPIGREERLKKAYPTDHECKLKMIDRFLSAEASYKPDWTKQSLVQARDAFAEILRRQFPELEDVVVLALANRFVFGWR